MAEYVLSLAVDVLDANLAHCRHGRWHLSDVRRGGWALAALEGGPIQALAVDGADPAIVYAGTVLPGVYKSVDQGQTVNPSGLQAHPIDSLAVSSLDDAIVYAGTDDGMFKSTDSGGSGVKSGPRAYLGPVSLDPTDDDVVHQRARRQPLDAWDRAEPSIATRLFAGTGRRSEPSSSRSSSNEH